MLQIHPIYVYPLPPGYRYLQSNNSKTGFERARKSWCHSFIKRFFICHTPKEFMNHPWVGELIFFGEKFNITRVHFVSQLSMCFTLPDTWIFIGILAAQSEGCLSSLVYFLHTPDLLICNFGKLKFIFCWKSLLFWRFFFLFEVFQKLLHKVFQFYRRPCNEVLQIYTIFFLRM